MQQNTKAAADSNALNLMVCILIIPGGKQAPYFAANFFS